MTILTRPMQNIRSFVNDREYFSQVLKIALPITVQNFFFSALNIISVMMIGQKGDVAVAAVGLAGQIFFLCNLVLFGMNSGTGIFTAQLWGKGDVESIKKVLGLSLRMSVGAALVFFAVSQLFPAQVLGIYSTDPAVIKSGAEYLKIYSWSFLFFAVTFSYVFTLRSAGNVRLPVVASVISLLLNAILTYTLVFGKLGMPEMGINGAALAALISRAVEFLFLIVGVYRDRQSPAAASPAELAYFDWGFTWKIMKPVLPVALNEILWSFGTTTYTIIFARMATETIAAVNIYYTIDNMAFIFFIGLANATAIIVGNKIGAHEDGTAYTYAGRSLGLSMFLGIFVGGLFLLLRTPILGYYNVSETVLTNTYNIMTMAAFAIWLRAANMIIIVGILRSGGDTVFSLLLDGLVIWFVGVPLAALGAFYFRLPIQWVFLLMYSEELTKFLAGFYRYFTRKWINNLTHAI